jgi:hypothetical protein
VVVLERAIILELMYQPLDHTNHRQENVIPYYQNHSPKHFQEDACSESCNKSIARLWKQLQTLLTAQEARPF